MCRKACTPPIIIQHVLMIVAENSAFVMASRSPASPRSFRRSSAGDRLEDCARVFRHYCMRHLFFCTSPVNNHAIRSILVKSPPQNHMKYRPHTTHTFGRIFAIATLSVGHSNHAGSLLLLALVHCLIILSWSQAFSGVSLLF